MTERFAPSPTGPLHLGHAFSAITAWNNAAETDGAFLLRFEDIDRSRARPEWEEMIFDDLRWLGLDWPAPVLRQYDRLDAYTSALSQLFELGLLYPCTCNRRDILEASSAPQEGAPMLGPDGLIYPGTCRKDPVGAMPEDVALRLNMSRAAEVLGDEILRFTETGPTQPKQTNATELITSAGDIVLARKDMGTSYHLAVVVDDAHQNITQVTRGKDLFDATPIHVLLQRLLELPTPKYHHHGLIRDENGKRLAKRDDAKAIRTYRAQGATPEDIYEMIRLKPLARK